MMQVLSYVVAFIVLSFCSLAGVFVLCAPFFIVFFFVRGRSSTPMNKPVKDEIVKAQREYDLYWKPRSKL